MGEAQEPWRPAPPSAEIAAIRGLHGGSALQGAFLQTTEAAARTGADRLARFRAARAEACESAGIVEALERLGLVEPAVARAELELLWRLTAMLTRLAKIRR